LYLPPYSPDFNPIEEAFAKIKGIPGKLKLAAARH
jgi:transposase